jgi:hypothetical protein
MKKIIMPLFMLNLLLIMFGSQAFAAYATATATINYNPFTLPSGFTVTSASSSTLSFADNLGGVNQITNSTNDPSAISNQSSTASVSQSSATVSLSGGTLIATSQAGPDGSLFPYSYTQANLYEAFNYTGATAATLSISLPYSLTYTIDATSGGSLSANAGLQAVVYLTRNSGGLIYQYEFIQDLVNPGQLLSDANIGTLDIHKVFLPGDTGTLQIYCDEFTAANATPTPLPAAAWLLGSGLLGLVGIRRRVNG